MINLGELSEDQLFKLFQKEYPDIIDLNEENKLSPVDWYIPELDIHIEAKCRNKHFPTMYIEENKYLKLIKYNRCWYVNSTPEGIFAWDVHKLNNIIFREKLMTNTQQFGRKQMVWKLVAELPISRCHFIFNHKLLY
jgi:hypothetical protein